MKVVQFPHIYIPEGFTLPTEQELQQMTRPLQLCSICQYVLCSCGNCHNSQLCNEACRYEQEEVTNE